MTTLFVSDLHLHASRPGKIDLFERFAEHARQAEAVYILGDLFEVWIGDDDDDPTHRRVLEILRELSAAGVALHVAHGNRDFLFGKRFEQMSGARLLPDFAVIDLYGHPALITHGDLLCTRDHKYQKFRRVVRNPILQFAFLAAPLSWRKRIAKKTQSGTRASMAQKAPAVMDVEESAVTAAMNRHQVGLLIHGHTHRPDSHEFTVQGRPCRRIVLGDWYEQDCVLVCDVNGQTPMSVNEFIGSITEQRQDGEQ